MRIDADLLERAGDLQAPYLHLYEWRKQSITYGHFIQPEMFLQIEAITALGWEIAKRSTGGGIVLHPFDMAFSVVVPASCSIFSTNTLQNYAFVNRAVLLSCEQFLKERGAFSLINEDAPSSDQASSHFCMARPTKYDVVLQGRKIAGAAQRKTRKGFLHQGMISLSVPPKSLLDQILLPGTEVAASMRSKTAPLLAPLHTEEDLIEAKAVLKNLLSVNLTALSLDLQSI